MRVVHIYSERLLFVRGCSIALWRAPKYGLRSWAELHVSMPDAFTYIITVTQTHPCVYIHIYENVIMEPLWLAYILSG